MPESKEFEPDLPKWLRESYKEEYQEVLGQELEKIKSNPEEYFGEQDLAPEEIMKLATEAQEILLNDFNFEGVHERMQAILSANIYESEKLAEDYKDAFTSLVKNVEMAVLRRMVSEYLPRRKAILHRGSTESVPEPIKELGPQFNWLKFAFKDPTFRLEEMEGNIEKGIGGFEFDIRAHDGEPVLSHTGKEQVLENAPEFGQLLSMVREVLPEDVQAERSGRRGLKLFLHCKVSENETLVLQKILKELSRSGLSGQTYIQTGRPEILYAMDDLEKGLKRDDPEYRPVHFAFQSVPLGNLSKLAKKALNATPITDRYEEGELHSMTNLKDEMPLLTQWPPEGRVLEILQSHKSVLVVPASLYQKELLASAAMVNLKIHIGVFDKGNEVEDLMAPDEENNRPKSVTTMDVSVIYPQKK